MKSRLQRYLCCLFLAHGVANAADIAAVTVSAWNESQLNLMEQQSTPLRWDNIEPGPWWVSGPQPRYQFQDRLHLFRLGATEPLVLRAPAGAWLRLAGKGKTLNPEDLDISVSTDARLFATATAIKTIDPYALLVELPRATPSLIRIAVPAGNDATPPFAAYFSREDPLDTLVPARVKVSLPGPTARLRREGELITHRARVLTPDNPVRIRIKGPTQVELVSQLAWPRTELRQEQSCVLQVTLGDQAPVPLVLSPSPDNDHLTRVDGASEWLSDRMHGFLEVPDGVHRLTIETLAPVYLSAYRRAGTDFLFPAINAPDTTPTQPSKTAHNPDDATAEASNILPAAWNGLAPGTQEQAAQRLARDNRPREAAGQAADGLARLADIHHEDPATRRTAESLRQRRLRYQELLPSHLPAGEPLRDIRYAPRQLQTLFDEDRPITVSNPTLRQLQATLVHGRFAAVPTNGAEGLLYELPAREADARLRVAALSSATVPTRFWVQLDQEKPILLTLAPIPMLPESQQAGSLACAIRQVLDQETELPSGRRPAPGFAAFRLPSEHADVGVVELPLQRSVRQVRIRAESGHPPVHTSLAFETSQPFSFGESQYLALLDQVDPDTALALLSAPTVNSNSPLPARELHNHLLPVIRLLTTHSNDFVKNVDLTRPDLTSQPAAPSAERARWKTTAIALENDGQFVEAIEQWNQLFWRQHDQEPMEACLGIMRCLDALGEEHLAAQYARRALLMSSGSSLPAEALSLLEQRALESDSEYPLEQLRAVTFLRCPCPTHLAALTQALLLNGREDMALWIGLLLPRETQPTEPLLQAALQQDAWQTFDRLVASLKNSELAHFWRAQKKLAFHDFRSAERELALSMETGRAMFQALREGAAIQEQLEAPTLSARWAAVLAWEQWLQQQPGPFTWQSAEDVEVTSFATEQLVHAERNRFSTHWRAEPSQPVKLRFLGPLRLQLQARPILSSTLDAPADDWLEVIEAGLTNRVPVSQCVPNPMLTMVPDREASVGLRTSAEFEWGPGWHEVEVRLAAHAALIQVQQAAPALPTRILPTLNRHRLHHVLQERQPRFSIGQPTSARRQGDVWRVPPSLSHPTVPTAQPESFVDENIPGAAWNNASQLNDTDKLRLALRMPPDAGLRGTDLSGVEALSPAEQWLAACRTQDWREFADASGVPETMKIPYWLATGRVEEVLESDLPGGLLPRLTTLLEISEHFPQWREQAQGTAEVLAAEHPASGTGALLSRLTRDRIWTPITVSPISAGLRPVQLPVDLPQAPSLRVRRALLPPGDTNALTLSGTRTLTVALSLQQPRELRLQAELVRAGFSPLMPLTVSIQLNADPVQQFTLNSRDSETIVNHDLPPGSHQLRMWIEDPVANQWVRIRLSGPTDKADHDFWSSLLAEGGMERRFFHGATPTQPVRLPCDGPAVLRVDDYRDGRFVSHLVQVPPGEQTVELPPAPGQEESWFQVFIRQTRTNHVRTRSALVLRQPDPLPGPALDLPKRPEQSSAHLTDHYPPRRQEEGTWTPSLSWVHRRPFERTGSQAFGENEFAEVGLAYRKQAANERTWFETEGVARLHRQSDLTLGLSERIEGRPQGGQFDWSWSGDAFVGTVDAAGGDTEWTLQTALDIARRITLNRKLRWRPSAGVFARHLSLDADTAAQADYIDQDLFTPYRDQHRWGGVLAQELTYRPWLDTRIKGDAALVSNEDFTPDNLMLRLAWDQLIGPVHGRVAYQFRQFLNDDDRNSSLPLHGISAGLFAEHWINGRHRVELGVQFTHYWPDEGNSYSILLRWDLSQGRVYKDRSPRQTIFRNLRQARVPGTFNNRLEPGGTHLSPP